MTNLEKELRAIGLEALSKTLHEIQLKLAMPPDMLCIMDFFCSNLDKAIKEKNDNFLEEEDSEQALSAIAAYLTYWKTAEKPIYINDKALNDKLEQTAKNILYKTGKLTFEEYQTCRS